MFILVLTLVSNDVSVEKNRTLITYIVLGCGVWLFHLWKAKEHLIEQPVWWYMVLPVLVSIQLLWMNRGKLSK